MIEYLLVKRSRKINFGTSYALRLMTVLENAIQPKVALSNEL